MIARTLKRAQSNSLLSLLAGPPDMLQIAALCYRQKGAGHEILLIKSKRGSSWILPKGWPMGNKTSDQVAAIEAWEEAGVKGKVSPAPIGSYHFRKSLGSGVSLPCRASAYALLVEKEFDDFPEKSDRKRLWLSPHEAAKRVSSEDLAALLLNYNPDVQ